MTIDSHEMRHSGTMRGQDTLSRGKMYVCICNTYKLYIYTPQMLCNVFISLDQVALLFRSVGVSFKALPLLWLSQKLQWSQLQPISIYGYLWPVIYITVMFFFCRYHTYIHVWVEWPWRHCCETSWPLSAIEQSFKWHYTQIKVNSKPGTLWKILCEILKIKILKMLFWGMYFH